MLEGDTLRLCKLTSCVSSVISYVPTPMANHRIKDGVVLFVPDFFGYPDDFAKNGFEVLIFPAADTGRSQTIKATTLLEREVQTIVQLFDIAKMLAPIVAISR
jgi:hypothetical protein